MDNNVNRDGDTNLNIIRNIPFWPTVCGVVSITCIGAFTSATMLLRLESISANVSDQKNISLSISGKMNEMQRTATAEQVRREELERRVNVHEVKIDDLDRRIRK